MSQFVLLTAVANKSSMVLGDTSANLGVGSGLLHLGTPKFEEAEGNTALGVGALAAVTAGFWNTAVGTEALNLVKGEGTPTPASEWKAAKVGGYALGAFVYVAGGGANTYYKCIKAMTQAQNEAAGSPPEAVHWELIPENGSFNTAVGHWALKGATSAYENTAVGHNTLPYLTTGYKNTALGQEAMKQATTGNGNTAIGFNALEQNLEGVENVAIGHDAQQTGKAGNYNVFIGVPAGSVNEGSYNIGIGYRAMANTKTATGQVAIGAESLYKVTGGENTGLGWYTGKALEGGAKNTLVGNGAGEALKAGNSNVAVGASAFAEGTGANNVAIGVVAGKKIGAGEQNVLIGTSAGEECGSLNVMLGYKAGRKEKGSNRLYIANGETTTPLILGTFPNALLQFNATEMGFFSHAVTTQPKVTGKKSTELEAVVTSILAALAGVGLVKDETT